MTVVAVSGSNFDPRIAVTNFISPTNTATIFINTGFQQVGAFQGCVVAGSSLYTNGDVTGSLVAVGHYGGGQVLIYDVSDPTVPTVQNAYDTGLGSLTGIGCLSLYGSYLLAGELNGPTIVLIDISTGQISSLTCPEFADGGISSIAICGVNGLLAVAAGPFGFDLLNYATPAAPTRQPYLGNIQGPFTCDFDGVNIAIGDGSGTIYVFQVSNGLMPEFPYGQAGSGMNSITSIAVMSGDVVEVAAGNFASPQVSLATFGAGTPGPPPSGSIFLGAQSGNQGGALAFYGWANLFASTNDGLGVTWYNVSNWPSGAPTVVATPFIVAKDANLASASVPTLAIAAFPTPPIRLHWPWILLPAWVQRLLQRILNIS
jgi:hypothetical protein